ncbi:MAG: DUF192 domain-containing protein [Geminicoccaceae bacterium]
MAAAPSVRATSPAPDRTPAAARQPVRRRALLAAALLALLLPPWAAPKALAPDELSIVTPGGALHFTVELASTPGERERGLMYRRGMQPDHGMLFDFQTEQRVAFWMRNTPLPLDILFIDNAGTIVQVTPDAVPYSETLIPSAQPVRAVLELNAGTAKRLGIVPGARVEHPIFAAAPSP